MAASLAGATSSISGGFTRALTKELACSLTVSTPHHYLVSLVSDWGDKFKSSNLSSVKLEADIECDEALFVYPVTFQASAIAFDMIAVHA